jgi:hypothetical protein
VLSFDRAISAECGTGKNDEDAKFQRRSYKERSTARHLTAILGTKPGMRHRRSQRLSLVGLLTHYMGRQVTRAVSLPPKTGSLDEWFNTVKEVGNDEGIKVAVHAGI